MFWQRKQGKADPTITCQVEYLRNLCLGIIYDSETVKTYLKTSPIQNTTRKKAVDTYMTFLDFKDLKWIAPKYKKTPKM